ncbi:MAG: hypothetical protein AAFX40_13510 [Cyanobacteria bacterium J06639_1]
MVKIPLLAIAIALLSAPAAIAQTPSCSKFASVIQRDGHQVYVRPGVTAIDFNPAAEVIRHVELSNPEKVSLNFDADLASGSATSLFLRPITGIEIPHLPSSSTTEMMVMTQNRQGTRRTYAFSLVYQPTGADCSVLTVHADTPGLPLVELSDRRRVPIEYVTMGLEVAARDGSLPYEHPLRQRVQNFLGLVQNGEQILPASQQAGLSVALVQELAQKGFDDYRLSGVP